MIFMNRLSIVAACLLCFAFASGAFAQSIWQWSNPIPTGGSISSVAYGNGGFVAIGGSGTLLSSSDGITWTAAPPLPYAYADRLTFAHDRFFASVGASYPGHLIESLDGRNWIDVSGSVGSAVVYCNGQYVSLGYGFSGVSTDGVQWTFAVPPALSGLSLQSIACDGTVAVGVGSGGAIVTSTDGVNWTAQAFGSGTLMDVSYGAGRFVAVGEQGEIATSVDGTSWSAVDSGTNVFLIRTIYAVGRFLAIGTDGSVIASNDGLSWQPTAQLGGYVLGIASDGAQFVAVGSLPARIFTSTDATTWTTRVLSPLTQAQGVAFGGGTFIAVGESGSIETSIDGAHWTVQNSGSSARLWGATYGNGTFVAAGIGGTILSSSDAQHWQAVSSTGVDYYAGAYGNGRFVLVGLGGTATSDDGSNWSGNYAFDLFHGVAYGLGKFVAVGGTIQTSTDGSNWASSVFPNDIGLRDVAFGRGQFVAVGDVGRILLSPDGDTWTLVPRPTGANLYSVVFDGGLFVAVGDSGTVLLSEDGSTWFAPGVGVSMPADGRLSHAAAGNGTFVAIGTDSAFVFSTSAIFADGFDGVQ